MPNNALKALGLFILLIAISACQSEQNSSAQSAAALEVSDFSGQKVQLQHSAKRIVALAPHIVENVYSAGAGDYLVGAVSYSNYPEAAKALPIIGGYQTVNLEKIIELQPDLIIAWQSGNANSSIRKLKSLGFKIYIDQADSLVDVAKSIRDIGVLSGTSETANQAASEYLEKLHSIEQAQQHKPSISSFYQVWNKPLQTINGQHIISDAIKVCGGQNIFADEPSLAPVVSIEGIIQRDPQAIIASGMSDARPDWLDDWLQWESLSAVKANNLFFVNPDHIQRHTVRILLGIESLCEQLDLARQRQQ